MSDPEQRRSIMQLMRSYRPAQVLMTCAELNLFETIGTQAVAAQDLAARLEVDAHALVRLLNAVVALGFLEKRSDLYVNSAAALDCLAAPGTTYIGNLVKREAAFHQRWMRLTQAVRTGRRPEENVRDERDANWVRNFELALRDAARVTAPVIAQALEPLIAPGHHTVRVVDVGGGHGLYSIALAEQYPHLHAVVFDLPPVTEVAREVIAESAVGDRVRTQTGDFKVDSLGSDFDLALLFGVLVSETPEDSIALLKKVCAALKPGGHVVIRGQYLAPDRTGPLEATLFDLQMLLFTEAGASHTTVEVEEWLARSGFHAVRQIAVPSGEATTLLAAQKPA